MAKERFIELSGELALTNKGRVFRIIRVVTQTSEDTVEHFKWLEVEQPIFEYLPEEGN